MIQAPGTKQPPLVKRTLRSLFRFLPKTTWTFNAGKLLTRTVLRPESSPHPVEVLFGGRVPMRLDIGTFVANDLYCLDDHYESTTLALWRRLAAGSSVILDVGSHIGTFALVAADQSASAHVVCVEADSTIFATLSRHVDRYPNVRAVRAAIASASGPMWFCPDGRNDGGGFLSRERTDDPRCYQIPTTTLTDLCRNEGIEQIDLMKMDLEGYEQTILADDDVFFERFAPAHLLVELTIDRRKPGQADKVFSAMKRRGYSWKRIQGLYAFPWGKEEDLANWHFFRTDEGDSVA